MIHLRIRQFVWVGRENGWRPLDAPSFKAGTGFLTAHDSLEHFNNDQSFESELLAFGSTLFIRMDDQATQANTSSSDLDNFLVQQHMHVKPPNPRWLKPLPEHAEPTLQQFLVLTKMRLLTGGPTQFDDPLDAFFGGICSTRAPNVSEIGPTLEKCAGWIRLGYRLAQRRFRGHTQAEVNDLFASIRRAVEFEHQQTPPDNGDILTVTLEPQRLFFTLEHTKRPVKHRKKSVSVEHASVE